MPTLFYLSTQQFSLNDFIRFVSSVHVSAALRHVAFSFAALFFFFDALQRVFLRIRRNPVVGFISPGVVSPQRGQERQPPKDELDSASTPRKFLSPKAFPPPSSATWCV